MPDEADARELKERAVLFMMRFLVKEISALSDLKDLVPSESPLHPVQKTEAIHQLQETFTFFGKS